MAAEIDTAHSAFAGPAEAGAVLELVDKAEAAKVLPDVFDQARRRQPGEMSRPGAWWHEFIRDPEWARDGDSELFHVVCRNGPGAGFVSYRVKQHWDGALAGNTLRVVHLVATDAPTRARLWRYCVDVDLMARVSFENLPLDEPMRWMLRDPRRLRTTTVADWLWVRLVDVARALAARRYRVEDRLVLEVTDAFLPENQGRYELEAGPSGARCRRSGAEPDLTLSVAELGSAYLGGVTFSSLAAAGRVDECTDGALARADLVFGSDPSPWCSTDF
jgi:predicted acetyltransferase